MSTAQALARRLPFHYGWAVVAAGALTAFACLGLGRFALGMLLPSMGASLPLTRTEMGWISTGNFIGYMTAVALSGRMVRRLGARAVVIAGLSVVGVSMILVSRAEGFGGVLLLYLVTGFGGGSAYVPVMGLVAHWFERGLRGRAAGFVSSGAGGAMVVTGLTVPAVNAVFGAEGWRMSWLLIGAGVLLAALVDILVLRNHPSEMALAPVAGKATAPATAAHSSPAPVSGRRILIHLGAVYSMFGFSYVIYATFVVTAMVRERGFPEDTAGLFWSWIGLLSLVSGPGFGALSDRIGRGGGLMIVFAFQAVAYALAAAPLPEVFLYVSAALFGLSLWAAPSIIAASVGDYLGPEQAASAFGSVTVAFACAQIIGPALAGRMADAWGSFSSSFALASGAALLGLIGAALLPKSPR